MYYFMVKMTRRKSMLFALLFKMQESSHFTNLSPSVGCWKFEFLSPGFSRLHQILNKSSGSCITADQFQVTLLNKGAWTYLTYPIERNNCSEKQFDNLIQWSPDLGQ
jgi:hypothetical protein